MRIETLNVTKLRSKPEVQPLPAKFASYPSLTQLPVCSTIWPIFNGWGADRPPKMHLQAILDKGRPYRIWGNQSNEKLNQSQWSMKCRSKWPNLGGMLTDSPRCTCKLSLMMLPHVLPQMMSGLKLIWSHSTMKYGSCDLNFGCGERWWPNASAYQELSL